MKVVGIFDSSVNVNSKIALLQKKMQHEVEKTHIPKIKI
jgi:hypothetical protein